jgi:hypothetical protein
VRVRVVGVGGGYAHRRAEFNTSSSEDFLRASEFGSILATRSKIKDGKAISD